MAWSWSHTQEAYDNAFDNLCNLSRDELEIIHAEIKASTRDECYNYDLNLELYEKILESYKTEHSHVLVDNIWAFMQDFMTCDNGGFNAYCCPYGCHTVSFDKKGLKP